MAAKSLPGSALARPLAASGLRRNNTCFGSFPVNRRALDWLPVVLLPVSTVYLRDSFPGWLFMWLLAFSIFLGCKWLTWRRACMNRSKPALGRSLGYFLAWPGMDATAFLGNREPQGAESKRRTGKLVAGKDPVATANSKLQAVKRSPIGVWSFAVVKTLAAAWLIRFAAGNAAGTAPLATGWLGMIGLVLFLHFGLFHLLALAWQRVGVNAQPLMCAPLCATSLAEFWSTRWNSAFNTLAHDLAFRPLARRWGIVGATVGVFLMSGLVHEAVISLPARGGYGLPTAYFGIQALGVLAERTRFGRRFGLGRGFRGWMFVIACTAAPVFWLFHPLFVRNVILPMLRVIGAN